MALTMGGPMAAFQIGQEIGRARSPVTGLGQAIRNIMTTAREKGMLQTKQNLATQGAISQAKATQPLKLENIREQALAQGIQSRQTAGEKRTYEEGRDDEMVDQTIIGAGTNRTIPVRRGDPRPVTEPSQLSGVDRIIEDSIRNYNSSKTPVEEPILPPSPGNRMYANNGQMRVYSEDGGNTWYDEATGEIVQ